MKDFNLFEINKDRNIAIYYEPHSDDNSPLIFFIHGAGGRTDQYRELFPIFRNSCSIIAFDFVGHGNSEKPFNGYDYYNADNIINDIKNVFDKYKKDNRKNIIIAHSYGTALTTLLYPLIQDDIHSIILIGTCLNIPSGSKHPIWHLPIWLLEWIRPVMKEPFLQKAYHSNTRNNNIKLIEYECSFSDNNRMHIMKYLAKGMKWPSSKDFNSISCPCLLISGEEDEITPVTEIELVKNIIPKANLVVLPNSSHLPMIENPNDTIKNIIKFLKNNNIEIDYIQE